MSNTTADRPLDKYLPEFYTKLFGKNNLMTHQFEVLDFLHKKNRATPLIVYDMQVHGVNTLGMDSALFKAYQNFKGTKADLLRAAKDSAGVDVINTGAIFHKDTPHSKWEDKVNLMVESGEKTSFEECSLGLAAFIDLDLFDGGGFTRLTDEALSDLILKHTLDSVDINNLVANAKKQLDTINYADLQTAMINDIVMQSMKSDNTLDESKFNALCEGYKIRCYGFNFTEAHTASKIKKVNTDALLIDLNAQNNAKKLTIHQLETIMSLSKLDDGVYDTTMIIQELNSVTKGEYIASGFEGISKHVAERLSVCVKLRSVDVTYRSCPMYPFELVLDDLTTIYYYDFFTEAFEYFMRPPFYYNADNPEYAFIDTETNATMPYGVETIKFFKNMADFCQIITKRHLYISDTYNIVELGKDVFDIPIFLRDSIDTPNVVKEELEIKMYSEFEDAVNAIEGAMDNATERDYILSDSFSVETITRAYGEENELHYGKNKGKTIKLYSRNDSIGIAEGIESNALPDDIEDNKES